MKRIVILSTIAILSGINAMEQGQTPAQRAAEAAQMRSVARQQTRFYGDNNNNQVQATAAGYPQGYQVPVQQQVPMQQPVYYAPQQPSFDAFAAVNNNNLLAQLVAEMRASREEMAVLREENREMKARVEQAEQAAAAARQPQSWAQQVKNNVDTAFTNAINITHFIAGYADKVSEFMDLFNETPEKSIYDLIEEKRIQVDSLYAQTLAEDLTPAQRAVLTKKLREEQDELNNLNAYKESIEDSASKKPKTR